MSEFRQWRLWASALDARAFERVWLALGAVAARPANDPAELLRDLVHRAAAQGELRWSFPRYASLDGQLLRLHSPATWSNACAAVLDAELERLPLRIDAGPADEPAAPWLDTLASASPWIAPKLADGASAMPLRIGALQPRDHRLLERWARQHAGEVRLPRPAFDCDLLVYRGDPDLLLQLLARRELRAGLLILGVEAGLRRSGAAMEALSRAAASARSGGFVAIERLSDPGLAQGLDRLLQRFEQGQALDIATRLAWSDLPNVVTYSPSLAHVGGTPERRAAPPKAADDDWIPASAPSYGAIEDADSGLESYGSPAPEAAPPAMEIESLPPEAAAADAPDVSSPRYLQQTSFVHRDGAALRAERGFLVGLPASIRLHIGPPEQGTNRAPSAFPVQELPQQDEWTLQVWLTEPDHLSEPLKGEIVLGRRGASTACELWFTPSKAGPFAGRISVLHLGRVLQTVLLRASVTDADAVDAEVQAPRFDGLVEVRPALADLDRRQSFDRAFVTAPAAAGQSTLQALEGGRAWLVNLRPIADTAEPLNTALTRMSKSLADYADGLDGEKGRQLLVELAEIGSWLHLYLVEPLREDPAQAVLLDGAYLQAVNTGDDAFVPFEFVYEYPAPDNDAKVCPRWRQAMRDGACPAACERTAQCVCPLGFWGLSKVIERHRLEPALAANGAVALQADPGADRDALSLDGTVLYGHSTRVQPPHLQGLLQRLAAAGLAARHARDWNEWALLVGEQRPKVLLAMAHADGQSSRLTVEIGGQAIKTIQISAAHIRPQGGEPPFVALLGCDMAGTGDRYASHVAVFRQRGAALVVGTIATVHAEHSADAAARLIEELARGAPGSARPFGEALRALKRKALLDGALMPLCLVAFGDAGWKISH